MPDTPQTTPSYVSVILPVFNGAAYVAAAIESVLAQTHASLQLICVNDGSTDSTRDILRSFGSKITHIDMPHNSGIGAARNAGVARATGDFIAFMDADDLWMPQKLEIQLRTLANNPHLDGVFCTMECFISPELPEAEQRLRFCPPGALAAYIPSACVVRAEAFYRVGIFEPRWRVGEFVDWFARAKTAGLGFTAVPDMLLKRRIHANNTGVRARDSRGDYIRILKASLDKRRGA